jgi:hypothetical protein
MRQGGLQRIGAASQCLAFVGRHFRLEDPYDALTSSIGVPDEAS